MNKEIYAISFDCGNKNIILTLEWQQRNENENKQWQLNYHATTEASTATKFN